LAADSDTRVIPNHPPNPTTSKAIIEIATRSARRPETLTEFRRIFFMLAAPLVLFAVGSSYRPDHRFVAA
jgi:hypothetical protein